MFESLDISYCTNTKCKNIKCERNQKVLNSIIVGNHPISIMNFKYCKYWEENNGK